MGDTGLIFNCRGDYFSLVPGEANALVPGKRPRSTLQSTLVTKDGRPYLITGSPGGDDQIMRTMQTLLNIVDFGMNVQQAIEAPRWSTAVSRPHLSRTRCIRATCRWNRVFRETVRRSLIAKGHKLNVSGPWSLGSSAAIMIDSATGVISVGADPRVEAYDWAR